MQQASEYTRHLKIVDMGADEQGDHVLEVLLEPMHLSVAGLVHGGMVFTLLDSALARAVMRQIPQDYASPTLEMKINYFRPVDSGKLTARGRVVNRSKQTCFAEGEVVDENDRLIAKASGTFFVKKLAVNPE